MGELYLIISLIVFGLIMLMGITYGVFNFCLFMKSWLYDKRVTYFTPDFFKHLPLFKEPMGYYYYERRGLEAGDVFALSLSAPLAYALAIGFGWPIFLLCGSVYLPLYTLRGFIRFKTKVNKAMENTDKEGHTHQY